MYDSSWRMKRSSTNPAENIPTMHAIQQNRAAPQQWTDAGRQPSTVSKLSSTTTVDNISHALLTFLIQSPITIQQIMRHHGRRGAAQACLTLCQFKVYAASTVQYSNDDDDDECSSQLKLQIFRPLKMSSKQLYNVAVAPHYTNLNQLNAN